MSKATLLRGRVKARRSAVQALYQWQLSGKDPRDVLNEFEAEREMDQVDLEYFHTLMREIPTHVEMLEAQLKGILDRPANELGAVERAVLWIGVYELMNRPDIPWRVVINEAIELTKLFGAEQAHKYVNGVLDKVAHALRSQEIAAA
jgi:N utilization substance protein B